jgi:hypothetical protein
VPILTKPKATIYRLKITNFPRELKSAFSTSFHAPSSLIPRCCKGRDKHEESEKTDQMEEWKMPERGHCATRPPTSLAMRSRHQTCPVPGRTGYLQRDPRHGQQHRDLGIRTGAGCRTNKTLRVIRKVFQRRERDVTEANSRGVGGCAKVCG